MTDLAMPSEKAPWTEERVETLKKLWADGLSASQIAGRLAGGVTRTPSSAKYTASIFRAVPHRCATRNPARRAKRRGSHLPPAVRPPCQRLVQMP